MWVSKQRQQHNSREQNQIEMIVNHEKQKEFRFFLDAKPSKSNHFSVEIISYFIITLNLASDTHDQLRFADQQWPRQRPANDECVCVVRTSDYWIQFYDSISWSRSVASCFGNFNFSSTRRVRVNASCGAQITISTSHTHYTRAQTLTLLARRHLLWNVMKMKIFYEFPDPSTPFTEKEQKIDSKNDFKVMRFQLAAAASI